MGKSAIAGMPGENETLASRLTPRFSQDGLNIGRKYRNNLLKGAAWNAVHNRGDHCGEGVCFRSSGFVNLANQTE
jgi:hypothetical protein